MQAKVLIPDCFRPAAALGVQEAPEYWEGRGEKEQGLPKALRQIACKNSLLAEWRVAAGDLEGLGRWGTRGAGCTTLCWLLLLLLS